MRNKRMTNILDLCVLLLIAGPIPAPLRMVTAEGLKVRQWPPSLTVMRGQSANLSCRFEATSYGVDWFKIEGAEKIPVPDSAGQTSLVITEVSVEDAGVYYCEVNVLHRDSERGGGTKLIVLAPPSVPQLLLQVPSDPQTDQWALLCVTGGFYPHHLTLSWTHQSGEDSPHHFVGRNCTIHPDYHDVNQSHSLIPKISTPDWMGECLQVTDSSRTEVYVISVLSLPPRGSVDAGIFYTCSVQDHPALDSPLSASFTWDAAPNEVIGCLNILKVCVLCGVTVVFSIATLTSLCERKERPRVSHVLK
uniref:uncharacterized protein LOC124004727 n=1 Tax=Oncorhynchus gorbuscha TaxID=8017 RepID=UPI001EAF1AF6|nr:uncharacterized protein LOC124004727 [Oncorhynchus gorbuscha]